MLVSSEAVGRGQMLRNLYLLGNIFSFPMIVTVLCFFFKKNQNNWAYMTLGIRNHIWSLDVVLTVYSIYIIRGRYEYRSAMSLAFIFIRFIYEYWKHRTLYTFGVLKMLFQSHKYIETTGTILSIVKKILDFCSFKFKFMHGCMPTGNIMQNWCCR